MAQKSTSHRLELGSNKNLLDIQVINHLLPYHTSEIILSFQSKGSRRITNDVLSKVKCAPASSLTDVEIFNGHFFFPTETETTPASLPDSLIGFGFWVNLYCFNPQDKTVRIEKNSIDLQLYEDLKVEIKQIKALP